MKKLHKFLIYSFVFILFINFTACKNMSKNTKGEFFLFKDKVTSEKENISKEERNKRLVEDLDYFKEALLEFPSNFNNFSEEDFVEKIDELKSNLHKLNDLEFLIELQKITSMFKEGHIYINKNPKRVYLQMEKILIGNDIHIDSSFVDDEFKYGKLIKINETDVESIKKKFRKITSADNYSNFLFSVNITDLDLLKGLGIVDNIEDVYITLEKNGKEKKFLIKPFIQDKFYPMSEFPPSWETRKSYKELLEKYKNGTLKNPIVHKTENAYNYVVDIPKNSVILNYDRCVEDIKIESKKFFENLGNIIIKQNENGNLNRIIIDLRRNSGGYRFIIKPFVEFLKEFFKENKEINLVILTDRSTLSAGMLTVMELRKVTNNYVVAGMPPGGGINFAGGQIVDYMPNTKLGFALTKRYVSRARYDTYEAEILNSPDTTEEEFAKNMLIPDIEAYKTVEDYENNTDSVLERALNGEFDKIK